MWNWRVGDGPAVFNAERAAGLKTVEDRRGTAIIEDRLADMDADGVAMEIAFPQLLPMFNRHPDLEAREWIFRVYNEYLAEVAARAPGRVSRRRLQQFLGHVEVRGVDPAHARIWA